jgi:hypothetical protein
VEVERAIAGVARKADALDAARRAIAIAGLLVCAALPAQADEPETASAEPTSTEPASVVRPPDRPVPDYDGLPEPGDDAGDVLLWTARILTAPLYFVTEFLIRRPLGWVITEVEQHDVIEHLWEFFTFGPNDNIAVYPTAFYEFGFRPSVGVQASWDELFVPEHRIATHLAFGGPDWLSFRFTDWIEVEDEWQLATNVLARTRPDFVYAGIGPNSGERISRFYAERVDALMSWELRLWQSSDLDLEAGYRTIAFDDALYNGDPSVSDRAQERGEALPFGYATGYNAVHSEVRADLDTRPRSGPPEGGVQVEAYGGAWGAFGGIGPLQRWVAWGGSTTLATDILGRHRVLGLTGDARLVSALDENVPFTELVDVGGSRGLLPGYFPGQVRGSSALGVTAHYTWPIWAFLDARLFFGTANAFGEHFEDFELDLLRLSFGLAFLPRIDGNDMPIQLQLAFATDTFESGADLRSFRFAIGATDVDVL